MQTIREKIITTEQALTRVRSGETVVTGFGPCVADAFLSELHTIAPRVRDVTVVEGMMYDAYPCFADPAYRHSFLHNSWFYLGDTRRAYHQGNHIYTPGHLHLSMQKWLLSHTPDLYIGGASLPDKHGFMSLSLSNVYERRAIDRAKCVMLEINPNFPRTFGDTQIHVSEVDYLIETGYAVPELPELEIGEEDRVIGKTIASMIQDGDCIQLGIGSIPAATAAQLHDKRDLGVHTELLGTTILELYKAGVITGAKKQRERGKMVTAFAMGSRELYDFIDDNPGVCIMDAGVTNDPNVIAQNDNQVSINGTLEVDLTGQCASESIGSRHYSGTGGQTDTALGAQLSRGGRSFIALRSSFMAKDPVTGERKRKSKIVPQLMRGAAVSLSRNDVDNVVTEYGVAALRGATVKERVERLIAIAHPDFREELFRAAYDCGILYRLD